MSYRIDDDENRIQDLKDQIDQLEVQTFSPEVVARNESTSNTGVQTGDGAVSNPFPLRPPIKDFGDVENIISLNLNDVDSHVGRMTVIGDTNISFLNPLGSNKLIQFQLDITMDGVGGHDFTFNNNMEGQFEIDDTPNARTILKIQTTDGGFSYQSENITSGDGGGDNLGDHIATQALEMQNNAIFLDIAQDQSIFALSLANNHVVPVGGAHDFFVNDTVIPKFGITETAIQSNVDLNMNTKNVINLSNLIFDDADQSIISLASGIRHDAPAGDAHRFRINSANIAEINVDGIELFGNSLILDADADTEINSITDDSMQFITGGELRATISNTAFLFTVPINMLGLNKITSVLDPTNPQDVATKAYVDASGGGTSFIGFLADADLDMDTKNVINLSNLIFDDADQSIISLASGIRHDAPAGDAHRFRINSANIAEINVDGIELFGNSLILDADADTEINSFSDDSMQFIVGGLLRAQLTNTAFFITTDVVFNEDVTLGSSSVDNIIFNGDTVGDITANVDNIDDIGALSRTYAFGYFKGGVSIVEGYDTGFRPIIQTNTGTVFTVPTAGGKTELRCCFQTGGSVLIVTEP